MTRVAARQLVGAYHALHNRLHAWTHPRPHSAMSRFLHKGEWVLHCIYLGGVFIESYGKIYAMAGGAMLVVLLLNSLMKE